MSLQSTDSHISLSLGKSYFSAAANNFAANDSDTEGKNDERDTKSSSSSIRVSL